MSHMHRGLKTRWRISKFSDVR